MLKGLEVGISSRKTDFPTAGPRRGGGVYPSSPSKFSVPARIRQRWHAQLGYLQRFLKEGTIYRDVQGRGPEGAVGLLGNYDPVGGKLDMPGSCSGTQPPVT